MGKDNKGRRKACPYYLSYSRYARQHPGGFVGTALQDWAGKPQKAPLVRGGALPKANFGGETKCPLLLIITACTPHRC